MYASSSATSAASQSTAPAPTRVAARDERQQPAINTAASSIAEPTVRSNLQVVAPTILQPDQPTSPESADRIAYRIQMLDFYKSEVVDPLRAFAEQRQQVPKLLRSQLETTVQEFDTVRENLNAKLIRTTLSTGQVDTLCISQSMAMTDQLKAVGLVSENLGTLDAQLVNAKKIGVFSRNPVQKAKVYRNELQALSEKMSRNLESQVNLTQVDEGAEQAQDAIDNQALLAQIRSQSLLECLTSETPVDPRVLQQFNDTYQELCIKTLGDSRSSTTLEGLENYFEQGLSALAGTESASQLNPLNDSLVQIKRIYAITVSLTNLISKDLPIENAVPKITKLKKDLNRCTNRSQQLQELFVKHPNVHVRKIAPLGAAAEVVQAPSVGRSESAKGHPKTATQEKVFNLARECVELGKPEAGSDLVKAFGDDVDRPDEEGRTAFLQAVVRGDLTNMFTLKGMGANVNATDSNGNNAFHLAAKFANPETMQILKEEFGFTDLEVKDRDFDSTAFLLAAAEGNIANLRALRGMGADVDAIDYNGNNAFHLAAGGANPETLRVLKDEFGFTDLEVCSSLGITAFLYAAGQGNVANLHALRDMGADFDAIDYNDNNAFILAAGGANPETLQVLKDEFGFNDLEVGGSLGITAFLAAAVEGKVANLRALKRMGANVNATLNDGNNAFHFAAGCANPETLQVLKDEFGFTELEAGGVLGITAFLFAALKGNVANLRALNGMGANINAVTDNGNNAFHLAAGCENPETLAVLYSEFGFTDLEVKEGTGKTAFLLAAAHGEIENLRFLKGMGANIYAEDDGGTTALCLAYSYGDDLNTIHYLESLGLTILG